MEATERLNSALVPRIGLNGLAQHICYQWPPDGLPTDSAQLSTSQPAVTLKSLESLRLADRG
jgi:hypothetical protein